MPATEQRWLTATDAARILSVSKSRIQQLLNDGTLPTRKMGSQLLFTFAEIEAARKRRDRREGKRPNRHFGAVKERIFKKMD